MIDEGATSRLQAALNETFELRTLTPTLRTLLEQVLVDSPGHDTGMRDDRGIGARLLRTFRDQRRPLAGPSTLVIQDEARHAPRGHPSARYYPSYAAERDEREGSRSEALT